MTKTFFGPFYTRHYMERLSIIKTTLIILDLEMVQMFIGHNEKVSVVPYDKSDKGLEGNVSR